MITRHNSLHLDKLRWLFWLRWKMVLRGFTRASGRISYIVGTIFQFLFGLLIGGGVGIVSYFGYRDLSAPANAEVLFIVLTGVYLFWLILPLFEFSINEGLDISKLALFPLTRAELMISLLFSTLLDVPTIGLFLVLGAVVLGWASSLPLALFALLTVFIFYAQIVGISQLVLALMARILQSRRFRDLSALLIIFFSSTCYIFQRFVVSGIGSTNFLNTLHDAPFSPYLQWLPPGMAARAIQQASLGNWGTSLIWLAALCAITVLVLYLWQMVVERGLVSSESGGSTKVSKQRAQSIVKTATAQPTPAGIWERLIPTQVWVMALKDVKYYRRDPQLLGLIAQSFISIGILLFIILSGGGGARGIASLGPWIVMVAPFYIFLSLSTLTSNILGFERQSLTTLFLFPIDPKRVLWGKNLPLFVVGIIEITLIILIMAFVIHAWDFVLPAFAVGLSGIGVVIGIGNFSSIFLPMRMRPMRRGFQAFGSNTSTQNGCLRALVPFASLLCVLIMLIPAELALFLPLIFNMHWVWSITIPLSLLYGIAVYFIVTSQVAPHMLERAPEILAQTTREE